MYDSHIPWKSVQAVLLTIDKGCGRPVLRCRGRLSHINGSHRAPSVGEALCMGLVTLRCKKAQQLS
jgi:hypothetical protein